MWAWWKETHTHTHTYLAYCAQHIAIAIVMIIIIHGQCCRGSRRLWPMWYLSFLGFFCCHTMDVAIATRTIVCNTTKQRLAFNEIRLFLSISLCASEKGSLFQRSERKKMPNAFYVKMETSWIWCCLRPPFLTIIIIIIYVIVWANIFYAWHVYMLIVDACAHAFFCRICAPIYVCICACAFVCPSF